MRTQPFGHAAGAAAFALVHRGFSGDGTRILFYRNEPPWHNGDEFQVWTVRPDHRDLTMLTTLGSNTDPDWQP